MSSCCVNKPCQDLLKFTLPVKYLHLICIFTGNSYCLKNILLTTTRARTYSRVVCVCVCVNRFRNSVWPSKPNSAFKQRLALLIFRFDCIHINGNHSWHSIVCKQNRGLLVSSICDRKQFISSHEYGICCIAQFGGIGSIHKEKKRII